MKNHNWIAFHFDMNDDDECTREMIAQNIIATYNFTKEGS